jgi:hypothetical protein
LLPVLAALHVVLLLLVLPPEKEARLDVLQLQ